MKAVEFMGMPDSGLGEYVRLAESMLAEKGVKARVHEGGKEYIGVEKKVLTREQFNSFSAERVIDSLLSNEGYLLLKRGLWDHIAFMGAMKELLPRAEYEGEMDYLESFSNLERGIVIVGLPPGEAVENFHQQNDFSARVPRIYTSTVNYAFLEKLKKAYINTYCVMMESGVPKENILMLNGMEPFDINTSRLNSFLERVF